MVFWSIRSPCDRSRRLYLLPCRARDEFVRCSRRTEPSSLREEQGADAILLAAWRDEDSFDQTSQLVAIAIHLDELAARRLGFQLRGAGPAEIRSAFR